MVHDLCARGCSASKTPEERLMCEHGNRGCHKRSECRRAQDAKRDVPVPLSPCARRQITLVPRFAPLRATAPSRRAPKGAVGLRHGPTSNGLTAYRMRLHLASAASGLRPSATPARRPRRRLPGTTGLRFALHGRQRGTKPRTMPSSQAQPGGCREPACARLRPERPESSLECRYHRTVDG